MISTGQKSRKKPLLTIAPASSQISLFGDNFTPIYHCYWHLYLVLVGSTEWRDMSYRNQLLKQEVELFVGLNMDKIKHSRSIQFI